MNVDIQTYINDVFGVTVNSTSKLVIRSDEFKAFKVTVKTEDRDKLFEPES